MELLKKFIFGLIILLLVVKFIYSQGWYAITITNTQSQATPAPFQQDIAICNGNINIGSNFAYINNATIFNEINPNGQNVYFVNSSGNILYSWYEGQLNYNGVYCDVWWINLPNGIPANSNVTIYMYIGSNSSNYYSQYYPYVGASPQVISGYDNGNYTFIVYGYFDNTFDGWSGYTYYGMYSPTVSEFGIEMLNDGQSEGTYILPPNNWNIPKIPLIVEEAWYNTGGAGANVIALFGNTNQQIYAEYIGNTSSGYTPASNLSTFVEFDYYIINGPDTFLKSAVTNRVLNSTSFSTYGGTIYSYLIVNSSYAQTGYYIYNSNQVWAPLTLLDTYTVNSNGYTYSSLNYNPYQYPTLEISAGDHISASYQYIEWVVARAYPPNGIIPSISIQPVSVSSTQTTSTVTTSTSTVTQTSTITTTTTTTVTTTLTSTYTITSTLTVYSTITKTTTVISSVTATSTTTSTVYTTVTSTSTVYNTVTSTVTTTLTSTNTVISTVYTTSITTLTSTSTIYSTITSTQTVTSTVYNTVTSTVTSTSTTTSTVSPSIYSVVQTLTGSSFTQTIPSTSYIYPINQISSITIINLNSSNISTSYTYSCSSNMT